jgi:SagB-type dehydrogenase family enzyme
VPTSPATRQVTAFHQLAALTEEGIAAAADAPVLGTRQPVPAPDVDLALPPGDARQRTSLIDALARRRSRRATPDEPLSVDQLAWLLGSAARATADDRRPHPSAGAAYPLHVDVVVLRCDGVPAGVHRYEPVSHGLRTIAAGDPAAAVGAAFGRDWVRRARVVIVLSADLTDATDVHAVRGYRYALLEAGHLGQNVLLLAAAADLPACPLGGFADTTLTGMVRGTDAAAALYAVAL